MSNANSDGILSGKLDLAMQFTMVPMNNRLVEP